MVSINRRGKIDDGICGGVLLSEDVILTSGDCITDLDSNDVAKAENTSVIVFKNGVNGVKSKKFAVKEIIRHENYISDQINENDIGIIRLQKGISDFYKGTDGIKFAKIHNRRLFRNKVVFLGWGKKNRIDNKYQLAVSDSNISTIDKCKALEYYNKGDGSIICSNLGSSNFYRGDFGGPLVLGSQ
ncbi:Trypsin epsilon [Smittium culicis]|uniref:Trypsin epsilon n=1 Tax=Smittium culicis TaxID=133412 RepID=A0A1R1XN71_9FUNG|nr:Trypsin epsilon [Smittium culicis]